MLCFGSHARQRGDSFGLAPSRRMAQCGRVGVPPLLRFMGPRGDVTLPRGHRGVRCPLPGGRQGGDSFGLAPSRRMAQCGRVGMPHAVTMGISPNRHREHVRTGGYSDGTGPGVMSGRRSLVHRNDVAPAWNAPRECSRPSFAQHAVLTCTLPATKKKAREGGINRVPQVIHGRKT